MKKKNKQVDNNVTKGTNKRDDIEKLRNLLRYFFWNYLLNNRGDEPLFAKRLPKRIEFG